MSHDGAVTSSDVTSVSFINPLVRRLFGVFDFQDGNSGRNTRRKYHVLAYAPLIGNKRTILAYYLGRPWMRSELAASVIAELSMQRSITSICKPLSILLLTYYNYLALATSDSSESTG